MGTPLRHSSFVGGEVTPSVHARVDLQSYVSWLGTCRNFIVVPQGGVKNRSGTQFAARTKTGERVMLLPFKFSQGESYILEFGHEYVRFYRNGAQIQNVDSLIAQNDKTPQDGNQLLANDGVFGTIRAQRFVTPAIPTAIGVIDVRVGRKDGVADPLRVAIWSDVGGLPGSNIIDLDAGNISGPSASEIPLTESPGFSRFTANNPVQFAPSTTLWLVVDSFSPPGWVAGDPAVFVMDTRFAYYPQECRYFSNTNQWNLVANGLSLCFRIYGPDGGGLEASTPYSLSDVLEIKGRTAQSADIMFIPHHLHPPAELRRYAETAWSLSNLVNGPVSPAPAQPAVDADVTGDVNNPTKSWWYVVTAIEAATGSESFGSVPLNVVANISSIKRSKLTLPLAVTGASGYNVYRGRNYGVYGYIGTTGSTEFYDDGQAPDYTTCPILDPTPAIPDPAIATPVHPDAIVGPGQFTDQFWYSIVATNGVIDSYGSEPVLLTVVRFGYPILLPALPAGATTFKIFRGDGQRHLGYIATSAGPTYSNVGDVPNYSVTPTFKTPTQAPGPPPITFDAPGKYPSCAAFFDQRLILAGSDDAPDTIWGSQTGAFRNFGASSPAGDDDAFEFTLSARTVDRIGGLIAIRTLNAFTGSSEYVIQGSKAGSIGPSSIDAKAHAHYGSGEIAPLAVGGRVLFAQREGRAIREFRFDFQLDGYTAEDERSVLAKHMLEGHQIVDWAYAKGPDAVVWMVRDDGVLLGMTYLPQHDVIAWHRHDTDGRYESVACIPEGDETAVYVSVARTDVNGTDRRFIERFASRQVDDVAEGVFLDCSLTYHSPVLQNLALADGTWLADSHTIAGFAPGSPDYFIDAHIGSQIVFEDSDGNEYRATIRSIQSPIIVAVALERDVPAALQAILISTGTAWKHALRVFQFPHMIGLTVCALVDGNVVRDLVVDDDGNVTLPYAGATVTVGLPYTPEIETLDVNVDGKGQTVKKVTGKVWFEVRNSRGLFVGEPGGRMTEWKQRTVADGAVNMNAPTPLATMRDHVAISGGWGVNGRVILQQRDPLPCEIVSVTPEVTFGG